jgi:hypothetical protein
MHTVASRAGRWPLALALSILVALSACSDDPVAPNAPSALTPHASSLPGQWKELTVTTASGGSEVGSLRWAVDQIEPAGGAIHFDPSLDGATITLGAPLDIDYATYIVGPDKGITLSGNDQHRVLDGDGDASLTNITLTKGYDEYGSAARLTSLYLQNSTVTGNRGPGSAIRVRYTLSLGNSTVSGNVVGGPALEYSERSSVFIDNSTVAFNAPGPGIGIYGSVSPDYSLLVILNNSILSNNGYPQQNCLSTSGLRYEGRNISNDWSCGAVGIGIGDPQLMPLANNGGPTMTHAIPYTSPAFNNGLGCYYTTDQRYVPRDAKCDIGAFEFNDFTKISITIDPTVKLDASGHGLLTGTIKCSRYEYFRLALELHQDQKVGKDVVDVHAASDVPIECTTSGGRWGATMVLTDGETYQAGAATASAQTFQTAEWATPAGVTSPVRISFARK